MQISIITVTYNSASTLETTINSIREQSAINNIEYIIVDGNSSDNTIEIIKENKDIISQWISEPDTGIYDAMNKGLKMASGDWIGYLHADDVLASKTIIEEIITAISTNNINALYGNLNYVQENDIHKTVRHWKSQTFKPQLLKRGWMPAHPTLYISKELFLKTGGFNTNYKIAADYDFILRLFSNPETQSFFLDKLIVNMRMGGASNKSFANIIQKSKEDYLALKHNQVGGFYSLFVKNFSKLTQFIKRN
ncbi:glycosyltransferase family 2 protein [Carboxylicivirga caseinilyticus]|uniref:glycosyltransferase family 2 protein n=1 Tax=Carboxylicivirga caseinilyticus TaxID=3417572 RepID=UPI003D33D8E6|nr:glycosyltransferase [Marinilabiliaceae bacterium A049]